jgi:transcription-repair coupling factor (superfamily II helicase)
MICYHKLNDANDCLFYPADQTLTSIMALGSPEFKSERIYTLKTTHDH